MQPKIFISYSWSTPNHEDWVLSLAQRLVNNGIDVVLDKWDLKEGQDKFVFMESMVTSTTITKVLIILDKKYAEKAAERDGGVGTETQIISPNVYTNTAQEKFIPVVVELDDDGNAYVPTYLMGRIYIDLSKEEYFEENYEKLLRSILNRPLTVKPKLGQIPSYILEDTPMNFKTTTMVRGFDSQIDKHPNRINALVRDFTNEFFDNLTQFRIKPISHQYIEGGKAIFENITQYIPLRDDYIAFISKLAKGLEEWDVDIVIHLFEKLPSLFYPEEQGVNWSNNQFDNFRFVTHELFIYTISVFLRNEQYAVLDSLFNSKYFIKDVYQAQVKPSSYLSFNLKIDSLTVYYEQLQGRKIDTAQADILIKRLPAHFNKTDFIDADLLCYYVGLFSDMNWFPRTYIYKDEYNYSFSFFNRLVSKKHFEKIKLILQIETVEELKIKLEKIKSEVKDNIFYPNSWSRVVALERLIEIELVATTR